MPLVTFNAFAGLKKKLEKKNIAASNAVTEIASGTSAQALLDLMELSGGEVESVMINGRIASFDTILEDGDRVAFLPRVTTGAKNHLSGLRHFHSCPK